MRAHSARRLVAFSLALVAAACGRPDPAQRVSKASSPVTGGISPASQTVYEGVDASWSGSISIDESVDGNPARIAWDFDGGGSEDETLCGGPFGPSCADYCSSTFLEPEIATDVPFPVSRALPADVDGDGDDDVVVFRQDDFFGFGYALSVLISDGRTMTPSSFEDDPSISAPSAAAVGDIDGDGDPDAIQFGGFSTVLFNDGAGAFSALDGWNAPGSLGGAALGDIDGSGDLDAVYVSGATLYWRLNEDGLGSFGDPDSLALSVVPVALAIADLDEDGVGDVILGGPTALVVYFGDGFGDFEAPVTYPNGGVTEVLPVDLDGVNGPDLVIGGEGGFYSRLNDGSGVLLAAGSVIPSAPGLALGDVDGDSFPDVMAGGGSIGGVMGVYFGAGDGSFATTAVATGGLGPDTAAAAVESGDFDDDGHADLLSGATRFYGRNDGRLGPAIYTATGGPAAFVRELDVNGDGDLDAAAAIGGVGIQLFLGDGSGALTAGPIAGPDSFFGFRIAHLNGDGVPDFALPFPAGVILSTGPMTWGAPTYFGHSAEDIAAGDIDGDGDLDLVAVDGFASSLQIFTNGGSGTFTGPTPLAVGITTTDIDIADVEGDGDFDIAFAGGTSGIRLLYNNGLGAFPTSATIFLGGSFSVGEVVFGDLDGDTDPDIVTMASNMGELRAIRNFGGGGFAIFDSVNMPFQSQDPRIGDVTGDGRPDVVFSSYQGSTISVFKGGEYSLSNAIPRTAGASPMSSALGDFDGDGRLDVVTANQSSNELSMLLSTPAVWTCAAAGSASYDDSGEFIPTLRATMTLGTAAFSATVTVEETEPEIVGMDPFGGDEGAPSGVAAYVLVPPGDQITNCTWDFGDGSAPESESYCGQAFFVESDGRYVVFVEAPAHTYLDGDPTDYLVTLTLDDEDGFGDDQALITIPNAAPSEPLVAVSGAAVEGAVTTLTAAVQDPAGALDAPFRVDFDFDYDGSFEVDASVLTTSALAQVAWSFPDSGARTIAAVVNDQIDGVTEAGSEASPPGTLSLTVDDHAPEVGAITGSATEMQSATFSASVAGVASDLIVSCVWDFGNGISQADPGCVGLESGISTGFHTYADGDPTDFVVTLTVTDEDGSSSTNTVVAVQNAPEAIVIDSITPQPQDEGSLVDVTATITAAAGVVDAPFLVRYVWGDGSVTEQIVNFDGPVSAPHRYADDRDYDLRVEVVDQVSALGFPSPGSLTASATGVVEILNANPSFAATADQTAIEGTILLLGLVATDPSGTNDPLAFSLVSGPAGMAVTPGGTLGWVPTYSQSGGGAGLAHTVEVSVADGDGGSDSVTFTVRAQWKDDDADGMADTWELAHGMDPTIDDSLADADGDGIVNINEFNGTGPFTPNTVTALAPLTGEEVNVEDPVLLVQNTTDGDSGALTYVFELYSDAFLATLVHDGSAVEGTAGMTAFALDDVLTDLGADGDDPANPEDVDLADDADYWWRARAFDGTYFGPWSPVQRFHYDPANDPPGVATIDSPVDLSSVTTLAPVLVAGNPPPDDDPPGTMVFMVYDEDPSEGASPIRTSPPTDIGPLGTTSWQVLPMLTADDTLYRWRVVTSDARGGSTVGTTGTFRVNTANNAPSVPVVLAPQDATSAGSLTPELTVGGSTDSDGDTITTVFELDLTPAFNSATKQSGDGAVCGIDGENRCFTPAALVENQVYWWRARATDGVAFSEPAVASFRVDLANDAPGVPVPVSPSDSLVITETPAFVALLATDPEDEALTYDFEVLDEEGAVVASESGVAAGEGSVTWTATAPLEMGGLYQWRVRAVDARGLAGALSAPATFEVYKKPAGGGGGGGCSVAFGRSPLGALLVMAALLAVRRRSA